MEPVLWKRSSGPWDHVIFRWAVGFDMCFYQSDSFFVRKHKISIRVAYLQRSIMPKLGKDSFLWDSHFLEILSFFVRQQRQQSPNRCLVARHKLNAHWQLMGGWVWFYGLLVDLGRPISDSCWQTCASLKAAVCPGQVCKLLPDLGKSLNQKGAFPELF